MRSSRVKKTAKRLEPWAWPELDGNEYRVESSAEELPEKDPASIERRTIEKIETILLLPARVL